MPIGGEFRQPSPTRSIEGLIGVDYELQQVSPSKGILYVPKRAIPEVIGKNGKNISRIEQELKMSIDVQPLEVRIPVKLKFTRKYGLLKVNRQFEHVPLTFYYKGDRLFSGTVGKKGVIKIDLESKLAKKLYKVWKKGETVYAREE